MTGLQLNVGLMSGINYVELVQQLVAIDRIPQENLLARTERLQLEKNALSELMSRFLLSSYMVRSLNSATPFKRTEVTSSNASLISVVKSASGDPLVGSYTFTALQMASSQQTVAKGVASDTDALGKTGTITLGKGWTVENNGTLLSDLNGGMGISKGSIRITDGSGTRVTIDLRKAVTIKDVINAINDNDNIDVMAELDGDHIVLRDVSGGDMSKFAVQEVSGGSTAASLGLVGGASSNDGSGKITGSCIWRLGESMSLNLLNDGNGVIFDPVLPDMTIHCRNGTKVTVDFNRLTTEAEKEAGAPANMKELTVGDVLNTINKAGEGKVLARISDDGKGIVIEDKTVGTRITYLQQDTEYPVLKMLGLTVDDRSTLDPLWGYDVKTNPASMEVTDKDGNTAVITLSLSDIELMQIRGSGMQELVRQLNLELSKTDVKVEFSVGNNGSCINLRDTSGGSGTIQISDVENGDFATRLGLTNVQQANALSTIAGSEPGKITLTDKEGKTSHINITQEEIEAFTSLQDIADWFNDRVAETGLAGVEPGDIQLTDKDGETLVISFSQADLDSIVTHQDIVDLFNDKIAASGSSIGITCVSVGSDAFQFVDSTDGEEPLKIEQVGGTEGKGLTHFLGINGAVSGETMTSTGSYGSLSGVELLFEVNADGGLTVKDLTGGTQNVTVYQPGVVAHYNDTFASRLGINMNSASNEIVGVPFDLLSSGEAFNTGVYQSRNLIGGLDTVLVATLNGGNGITATSGVIEVQDRAGNRADIFISQTELKSMNTLSDAVKLYNQKLSDAGIGITVKINDQKTGLTLVDTTGSATHNMVFKDQTKSILVPGVDPIDAVDAVSGKIAGVDAVSFGMSAYSRLNFGKTGVLNGFTFQFTENPLDEGYVDDGTNKTFTFYLDRAAITAESDLEVRDQMVKDAIDNLIAAEWANIYPPATYGVIPPPEVSIDGYTAGDFAADALDDAFWGYNSSIWISSYSTLGQAEGTAVLTFETTWMNQFTFGFTTDQSLSGYISSSQKFNFYIDQDILDETDPATRDDMVKAAIDAQIATIWANDMPAVFREVDPPEVTLVAGLGDQAVYDAIFGGETAIKSSAAGAVMGQPAYAGIPDETIQHTAKIASAFGLNVDAASSSVAGSSLNKQCVSYNTLLSDLNGGAGVNMIGGKFEITDSRGGKYTITVDTKTMKTVGDFCDSINRISGLYVKAKINDSGDGIVLEEYGGGTQSFSCYDADSSSKFLSSLGLSGSVSQSKKDDDGRLRLSMSETHHIEVEAKDSLEDIRKKINDLNVGYSASILVDGSSTPYRLSISGKQTGAAGSFNVDLSAIGLSTEVMSEAKDAMIAYGDASKSNALTLTSKTNSFKGIINGMDLTITGVSDTPVTITSASSSSDVKVRLESFVNNYNNFRQYLNDMMRYSVSETKGVMVAEDGGYLWNSSVAKSFDRDVTDLLLKRVTGIPGIYSLADLGISVRRNFDDVSESIGVNSSTNSLIFDADKFQEAWDRDPEAVQKFFYDEREYVDKKGEKYTEKLGWAQKFEDLTDSLCGRADVLGKVQSRVDALTSTIDKNEARIAFLEERLKWKEQNYLKQFYAMEQAMARMTKDSSAIASIASNWQANSNSGG